MNKTKFLTVGRRQFLGGAGLAVAGLGLSGGQLLAQSGPSQVLKVIHPRPETTWSPLRGGGYYYRWNSIWWAAPQYLDESNGINPYVIKSCVPNERMDQWVLTLADDVRFSDGSPITVEDIKGSWELCAMPLTKSQRIDQVLTTVQGYQDLRLGNATELSGVKLLSATQIAVDLVEPDPLFEFRISNHLAPVVKVSQARGSDGNDIQNWWHPDNGVAVSGPFKPVKMDLDAGEYRFEVNENFFGPKPKLEAIEITLVEDSVTAVAMLERGSMHANTDFDTPTLTEDLGKEFTAGADIPQGFHFWFDRSKAPFDDVKVREALILAVNRDELIQVTAPHGPSKKADQILTAVSAVDPDPVLYPYDPERARQLLSESKYKSAEHLPRIIMLGVGSDMGVIAAQYIMESWRQTLGITAVETRPQYDEVSGPEARSIQIIMDDVGTRIPDGAAWLRNILHSGSAHAKTKLGGYVNPEIDALLEAAVLLPLDDPERDQKAREAQRLFAAEFCYLPWRNLNIRRLALANVRSIEKNVDWQVIEPWNMEIL